MRNEFPSTVYLRANNMQLSNFFNILKQLNMGGTKEIYFNSNDWNDSTQLNKLAWHIKRKTIAKPFIITSCNKKLQYRHFTKIFIIQDRNFDRSIFLNILDTYPRRTRILLYESDPFFLEVYGDICIVVEWKELFCGMMNFCLSDIKNSIVICDDGNILCDSCVIGNINDDTISNIWNTLINSETTEDYNE